METSLRDQLGAHLEEYVTRRANKEASSGDETKPATRIPYGTAGFRGNAVQIEHLFFNVGLVSGLRCLKLGANIGIMITASHNPIQDNGVKLIDSQGEMLEPEWEQVVEKFCNLQDKELILDELNNIATRYGINLTTAKEDRTTIKAMIGMDTRPSSEALVALVKQGLDAWSPLVNYIDYGLVTTPALHFLVAESNRRQINEPLPLRTYYDQLIAGTVAIFSKAPASSYTGQYSPDELVIDCANGVGSETMQYLIKSQDFYQCLPAKLINTGDGILNRLCGADYVKTVQLPPSGAGDPGKRYAALDGDADRVVYFYLDRVEEERFKLLLLDGDKIMALYAHYLKGALKEANLHEELSMGIVQTAYANGASTDYLTQVLQLKVDCVDTGVKNLHKQALNYDIGIYFEANGHGTIWVSQKARLAIDGGNENVAALKRLLAIINNYTGDAISDILVVETILRHYDWDVKQWYNLYQDRPNLLTKIEIQDRSVIKTTNAGRTCVAPEGLQSAIESVVGNFGPGARSFVRPSGTENIVRIYAEAQDQASAERLAYLVGDKVRQFCMQ